MEKSGGGGGGGDGGGIGGSSGAYTASLSSFLLRVPLSFLPTLHLSCFNPFLCSLFLSVDWGWGRISRLRRPYPPGQPNREGEDRDRVPASDRGLFACSPVRLLARFLLREKVRPPARLHYLPDFSYLPLVSFKTRERISSSMDQTRLNSHRDYHHASYVKSAKQQRAAPGQPSERENTSVPITWKCSSLLQLDFSPTTDARVSDFHGRNSRVLQPARRFQLNAWPFILLRSFRSWYLESIVQVASPWWIFLPGTRTCATIAYDIFLLRPIETLEWFAGVITVYAHHEDIRVVRYVQLSYFRATVCSDCSNSHQSPPCFTSFDLLLLYATLIYACRWYFEWFWRIYIFFLHFHFVYIYDESNIFFHWIFYYMYYIYIYVHIIYCI